MKSQGFWPMLNTIWDSLHEPSNWCIREESRSRQHECHIVMKDFTSIPTIPSFHPDMFLQDAPHFQDGVRIALGRVARVDDQLRLYSIDMRAFVGNDSVAFSLEWGTASHSDDRVRRNTGINRKIIERSKKRSSWTHVF